MFRRSAAESRDLLRELIAMPGVETVDAVAWDRVMELWPTPVTDFADAVLAAVAIELKIQRVATFDRKLARQLRRLGLESLFVR